MDRPIHPEPAYRTLHFLYVLLVALLGVSWWYLPLAGAGTGPLLVIVSLILAVAFGIWLVWVPLYYRSLTYRVTRDEVHWEHGVLWQHQGIVPYNRITDVDVLQGPLMRLLGISTVRIQTAGQRSQSPTSEIKIAGVEVADELQSLIMDRVRERPASASAHGGDDTTDAGNEVLTELRRIRQLLEDRASS